MKIKLNVKVTYNLSYEVNSDNYGTENIKDILNLEKEAYLGDPLLMIQDHIPVIRVTTEPEISKF